MVDSEGSLERLQPNLDPVACLIQGESLAAAGELQAAHTAYSTGLQGVLESRHSPASNNALELIILEAALHYSRADARRRMLFTESNAASLALLRRNAYHDLSAMRLLMLRTPELIDPLHPKMDEESIQRNAVMYLGARGMGFLHLTTWILGDNPTDQVRLAHALNALQHADTILAAGIMLEEQPVLPRMPHLSDQAGLDHYHAELIWTEAFRRRQRRQTDPELQQAIAATEALLNRRGQHQSLRGQPFTAIAIPDLSQQGRRVSEIFDLTV